MLGVGIVGVAPGAAPADDIIADAETGDDAAPVLGPSASSVMAAEAEALYIPFKITEL